MPTTDSTKSDLQKDIRQMINYFDEVCVFEEDDISSIDVVCKLLNIDKLSLCSNLYEK